MRLRTKWLLVSVVGGVLIPVALFCSDTLFDAVADVPGPLGAVANVVLWPVAACVYLSGPGPNIGTPEKPFHEWTPVQDFAVVVGIGLSWVFYSSVLFLIIWIHHKRRALRKTSAVTPATPGQPANRKLTDYCGVILLCRCYHVRIWGRA